MILKLIRGERQPVWYSLTAVVISCLLCTVISVLYTRYEAQRIEKKFCAVINVSVGPDDRPPPGTTYGRAQREEMKKLGRSLSCPKPK